MKMNTTRYIAVLCVLVTVSAGVLWTLYGQPSGEEGGDASEDRFIGFYFYDNFENDHTSGLLSENRHLAAGYWVKGYGDTKMECFADACGTAGLTAETDEDGKLLSVGDVDDGNFCVMGWAHNAWTAGISLISEESYKVRFMAIGHGRWTNGIGGTPPTPYSTPDGILWYADVRENDDAALVYFYDNYENDGATDQTYYPYPSELNAFIANGYWVYVLGGDAATVLAEACSKAFGRNTTVGHFQGKLTRIGDVIGNLSVMIWNGSGWEECDMTADVRPGMCLAVGHGYTSPEGPPAPWDCPGGRIWSAMTVT